MIRSKTLRAAARYLLGALIAAYAMVPMHAAARAPQGLDGAPPGRHMAMAMAAEAAEEEHCNERANETPALMCKYHCQSVVQTLDHPDVRVAALSTTDFLLLTRMDTEAGNGMLGLPPSRPDAARHGGAPPPYRSTARLRI